MKNSKKGQVGGLQGFVLSIVTVAVVLAIGLIVMSEMQGAAKVMGTSSSLNETVAHNGVISQSSLYTSPSACRNLSTQGVYTIGTDCNISSGGVLTSANQSTMSLDYAYYTPSAAYNSSGTIITKLATVPTWIGIIIIIALAFIVLSFFIGKRQ